MEQSFLKTKMAINQVENVVDINTLLKAFNAQNHLQMLLRTAQGFKRNSNQKTWVMLRMKRMNISWNLNLCCRVTAAGRTATPKPPFDKLIVDSLLTMSLQCLGNPQT